MKILLWINISLIIYVFFGYITILKVSSLIRALFKRKSQQTQCLDEEYEPSISVIIAAYNEEEKIQSRLENILSLEYARDKFEIIVASDGSDDRTVPLVKKIRSPIVRLLDFKNRRGRASVQNEAVKNAKGDILVFTDANTEFHEKFLIRTARLYRDNRVGSVIGNLIYRESSQSIAMSEGFYWKYEKKIRELESNFGILFTGSGACMSVRKELWRNLRDIDDCDFTTPLDVILQGKNVIYAPDAIAYDEPVSSFKGELATKIRQTSKNFVGTLKRWRGTAWIKHPLISCGLLSHKILRWLTPVYLICIFISTLFLLDFLLYKILMGFQLFFYMLAMIGFIAELRNKRIFIISPVFNFCLASIGMFIGLITGMLGKAPAVYKTEA